MLVRGAPHCKLSRVSTGLAHRRIVSAGFSPRSSLSASSWSSLRPAALRSTRRRAISSFAVRFERRHSVHPVVACRNYKKSGTGLWSVLLVLGIVVGGAFVAPVFNYTSEQRLSERIDSGIKFDTGNFSESYPIMTSSTPPGRPGTLAPEEEGKLRELWAMTLKVFGVDTGVDTAVGEVNGETLPTPAPAPAPETVADKDAKKEKKKSRLNVFKRYNKEDKSAEEKPDSAKTSGAANSDPSKISVSADDDKFGQNAAFKAALANTPPEELRKAFWTMVKHDHPDALLLRFLRARKWDVEKALVMMISTMQWRLGEMHVDDDIMKNGELAALHDAKNSDDPVVKKNAEDFLMQLRKGKSFLHGVDNEGRPMCFVRARLHHAGDQTEQTLEKFTVYLIETARMVLRPPVDTATIVFDMTDFSLSNMDYTPVKFMIKCFEANYPESLGAILVYKAPWLFNAIWSIIRGWLDPVVAAKVHFAKDVKDLEKFVDRNRIMKELGGDEDWSYEYVEPVEGENARMASEEGTGIKQGLEEEREGFVKKYEEAVAAWVRSAAGLANANGSANPTPNGNTNGTALPAQHDDAKRRADRDSLAESLRANYWKLDPYVRARSVYDRWGVLGDNGALAFYTAPGAATAAADAEKTKGKEDGGEGE